MLGFQADMRLSESILLLKWPRNAFDVEDDAYETLVFVYNKELDVFVLANYNTKCDV